MLKIKGKRKKGFTLVELMVVIAIIAVLLLVAVPRLTQATRGARVRTFEANFRTAVSAVNAAYADTGMRADAVATHPAVAQLITSITTGGSNTGKPSGATYAVDGSGVLTATLTEPAYVITFNPATSVIDVTTAAPDSLGSIVDETP